MYTFNTDDMIIRYETSHHDYGYTGYTTAE